MRVAFSMSTSCIPQPCIFAIRLPPLPSRILALRSSTMADDQTPRMAPSEQALVRRLHFEQGKSRSDIARLLQRSLSSISRLLAQKKAPRRTGRPKKLTDANIDRIVATPEKMVDSAEGDGEVTLRMLMRRCRVKVSERTVSTALHRRGYRFRNMRQKPILTPTDIEERYRWSRRHRGKSAAWWQRAVHIHLDNKSFKLATTQAGRKLLAKRMVRGVYRKKGKSLRPGHVKPNTTLADLARYNLEANDQSLSHTCRRSFVV